MKIWAVAAAALSLTALCACSSTEDEKAPGSDAGVEDQWKYHVKKNYPQWQAPAENPAPAAQQAQASAPAAETAAPAVAAPEAASGVYTEPKGFVVKDNVGAYEAPKPEVVMKGEGYSHYTVKKGDSLWTISKLVYRDAEKWRKIYDVNKDVIKDPKKLKPGLELKIPAP